MKKILIVEDEAFAVMSLKYYLEELGFSCATAATEAEALSVYFSFSPDFVLMDVSLADGSDGISAAEKILQKARVPICFMTGYSDDITISRAENLNPVAVLDKPVSYGLLSDIIERHKEG